jgi:hypothetical protein
VLDDSAAEPVEGPITPGRAPILDDPISGLRKHARSIEQGICREVHENVPIYGDPREGRYRDVLTKYEQYMIKYESRATRWQKHLSNIKRTIAAAIGLSQDQDEFTEEEREKLREIGIIAIFGSGGNPTRGLPDKLLTALQSELVKIILIDFSKHALESAINNFSNIGITPLAAYQMDLSMGTTAHINNYAMDLKEKMDNSPDGGDVHTYIRLIENEIESIIEAYETGKPIPGFFNNYPIIEEHRPGLAISEMVTAATFLPIYEYLLQVIRLAEKADSVKKNELIARLNKIHAKFNAFILRLNSAKMVEMCTDNANVLILTDVNKVSPTPRDELQSTAEDIKAAIDVLVSGKGDGDPVLAGCADYEVRMSRNGCSEDPLKSIIGSVAAIRDLTFETLGQDEQDKDHQWMWWDERAHGHRVEVVKFKMDRGRKKTIVGLLQNLPHQIAESGDPVTAARMIMEKLQQQIESEEPEHGFTGRSCLQWLRELQLHPLPIPEEILGSNRKYMHKGAREILENVPREIIEQGFQEVLVHLQKHHNWVDDAGGITRRHIATGLDWLRRFSEALREEQNNQPEPDSVK